MTGPACRLLLSQAGALAPAPTVGQGWAGGLDPRRVQGPQRDQAFMPCGATGHPRSHSEQVAGSQSGQHLGVGRVERLPGPWGVSSSSFMRRDNDNFCLTIELQSLQSSQGCLGRP